MMITPSDLAVGMAYRSTSASLQINDEADDNALLIQAANKGISGNRISIAVTVNADPGVPTCELTGNDISFRLPSSETAELSGAFFYNGSPVEAFLLMWYAGQFNSKKSWSLDGEPVTWPLVRDGEFLLHAEGSWHVIQRLSGVVVLHWQADSDADEVYLIPEGAYGPGNLEAWRGIAALCTGEPLAHIGVDITTADNLQAVIDGIPGYGVSGNPLVAAMISVSLVAGQSGLGNMVTMAKTQLDGGR